MFSDTLRVFIGFLTSSLRDLMNDRLPSDNGWGKNPYISEPRYNLEGIILSFCDLVQMLHHAVCLFFFPLCFSVTRAKCDHLS